MKEYITISGKEYPCLNISTTTDNISMLLENQNIDDVIAVFKPTTSLTVAGEDKKVYGIYNDLSFKSAMINEDETILVTMSIASDIDKRLAELEKTQIEQDEAIAEIVGGELDAE